jgi:hypothetical protein
MADDDQTEVVRELRRIRYTLYGILLILALMSASISLMFWAESTRPPVMAPAKRSRKK